MQRQLQRSSPQRSASPTLAVDPDLAEIELLPADLALASQTPLLDAAGGADLPPEAWDDLIPIAEWALRTRDAACALFPSKSAEIRSTLTGLRNQTAVRPAPN
ncbi:MAG: hypothetical protein ACI8PZ_007448 [Myxococcota bacterium]